MPRRSAPGYGLSGAVARTENPGASADAPGFPVSVPGGYDGRTSVRAGPHERQAQQEAQAHVEGEEGSQCFCCSSRYMSSAKEEKVVKPPQNPVMSSTFIEGEIRWVFSAMPKRMPMMKLPTIVHREGAHGNGVCGTDVEPACPSGKLRQVPMKPPQPAKIIALNMVSVLVEWLITAPGVPNTVPELAWWLWHRF